MDFTFSLPDDQVYRVALAIAEQQAAPDPVDDVKQQTVLLLDDIERHWQALVSGKEVPVVTQAAAIAKNADIARDIQVTHKDDGAVTPSLPLRVLSALSGGYLGKSK